MTKRWPSRHDALPRSKTDVYYDEHMKMHVPIVKKAKSKKVKSRLSKLKINA